MYAIRSYYASFSTLVEPTAARAFFETEFADALALLEHFDREFADHPIGVLGTIRSPHWHVAGKGLIIGDAAHAVVRNNFV